MIFPERLELVIERILLGDHQLRYRLPWVFLWIPHLACIFDWLIVKVLAELELKEIFSVVSTVEVLQPVVEDVRFVGFGLDSFLVKLLLGFGGGDEAVFADVIAEAVGSLGVLAGGFEVGVPHCVPEFLQVGVWAGFEVLVEFGLVAAVFDSKVDDLPCCFCIC